MDDKKQEMMITIFRKYQWVENRINLNFTHPYWLAANKKDKRKIIRLDSEFVEKCLWTPKLQYIGARKINLHNPSPTSIHNSAMEVYLSNKKEIKVSLLNLQLTLVCTMDFHNYPFDRQVRMIV